VNPSPTFLPPQPVIPNGRALYFAALAHACRPQKRLTVSQWADRHRKLTSKASSETGPWKTERVPYLREIMDCLSARSPVRSVSIMKSAQVGGTEIALNWAGYIADHCPAPTLIVVPTLEVRKRWVRQRLDPMLTETPALAAKFNAKRKRDGGNAEDMKDFEGGLFIIAGANSPASLASMPIKFVINDEIDRFPWEAGAEGDPLGLIRKRQQNFSRRKELNISTPTVKDASRIEELFLAGDQRYYHVPCPHCGEFQPLKKDNLVWTKHPETREITHIAYACAHCGTEIDEHHKPQMLAVGRWVPTHPERKERSYHINGLYAPLGLGLRWAELAREWLTAQDDKAKLKRFINTDLGEVWEDRTSDLPWQGIMARAEPYQLREIPRGCLVITGGVDTHPDRLEVQLVGHGRHGQTWTVDWLVFPGDPTRAEVWDKLTEYLNRPLVNGCGRELRVEATLIDTGGHNTHDVYNYVRTRAARRLMAGQGANTPGKPILSARPKPQDVNWKGKIIKRGVMLWSVGTDTAKAALFARLRGDSESEPSAWRVHTSNALPEDYYKQLTAEAFDPEHNRWVKRRGRRNEALDTWVYAVAASQHPEIRVHAMRASDWTRLEQMLEPPGSAPAAAGEAPAPGAPPTAAPPEPLAASKWLQISGGFVNRWRK